MPPLLRILHVTKTFPGVTALDDVSLSVGSGEVVGLIGENGAGKSTLVRIVAGASQPDAGAIELAGRQVRIPNALAAQRLGISVIYQELNLAPHLSVEANLFLGREATWGGPLQLIRRGRLREQARRCLGQVGLRLDPRAKVGDLPLATRQRVEVAKALSLDAGLVVMDEPTSSLSADEARGLLDIVRGLRQRGVSVLYISHKLDEVLDVADRIVCLRDGKNASEADASQTTRDELVHMMVGRQLSTYFPKPAAALGEVVLDVRDLACPSLAEPVSFVLRAGEVLGFAGLVGAGRTELMRALFGAETHTSGSVRIGGRVVRIACPRHAVDAGLGLVPEDRKEQGLVLPLSVRRNISLPALRRDARWGFVARRAEADRAARLIGLLGIRTPSDRQPAANLSGGNQQKIVLAKWLALSPKVLILDEPTRGIDVGSKAEVHRLIADMAGRGMGILLVSSEMEEIIGMCHRAVVLREARVAGVLERGELTEGRIMALAAHDRAGATRD